MKKIVSAVALTALAGSLFAADLTVKSEIKYQPVAAEFDSGKGEANDIVTKNEYKSQNLYATQATTKDTTTIQLKQDNVTVFGKFDLSAPSTFAVNSAYAALAWGKANITAGFFESRFTNRVTTDQNDLSLIEQNYAAKRYSSKLSYTPGTETESGDWENDGGIDYTKLTVETWSTSAIGGAKKLGINTNLGLTSKAGVDADNVTSLQGSKANAFVIDYTIADPLPGKLLLKAVAKTNKGAWDTTNDDGDKYTATNSGFSFEAAFTHELFTADTVVNLDADNVGSFGFYARPTVLSALNAVVGFTYAWDKSPYEWSVAKKVTTYADNKDTKINTSQLLYLLGLPYPFFTSKFANTSEVVASGINDDTFWAVDLRARYAITDALAAGVYANLTSWKLGWMDEYFDLGAQMALDVVLNVNFKINDLAKVFVEGEYAQRSFDSDLKKMLGADVVAQAGVILTPAKGATLTGAVRGVFSGIGAGKVDEVDYAKFYGTSIVIPLSFKCSL